MIRRIWSLAFVCTLVLPPTLGSALGAQQILDDSGDSDEVGQAEVFLGAFRAIRNYHMDPRSDSVLWEMALDGLLERLDDPYATVFSPEEFRSFQEGNTGNYAGIGVTITELNDRITVTAVFRDAPADRAGLEVGDVIVGVDGQDTSEWAVQDASNLIRGPVGSTVEIEVMRPGVDRRVPLSIERDNVHVSAVTASTVGDGIGYILLDRVARNSTEEVEEALSELEGSRGLIIDLRRNPGGYLDEALNLVDLFIEPGEVMASARSRVPGETGEPQEETWESQERPRVPDLPIVVLVDQYSASASEIIAGALQDHDRALVIGERTFGKGVVQTVMRIPGGWRIRLTTGSWYTPLGRSLHRPRDAQGNPVRDARSDGPASVVTAGGREIEARGGGIYPDLPISTDTLSAMQQQLFQTAAESSIPLNVRLAEFAFEQSRALDAADLDGSLDLDPEAFAAFVDGLAEEGLSRNLLDDSDVIEFMSWRIRGQIADRLDRTDVALTIRMERDPMLSRALGLLEIVDSQPGLFAAARAELDARESVETADATVPSPVSAGAGLNR